MYQKLKTLMQEKNITTNKLAKLSSITPQDLYTALKGNKPMYPNWKKSIAEALNTDVESLFIEEGKDISDGTN